MPTQRIGPARSSTSVGYGKSGRHFTFIAILVATIASLGWLFWEGIENLLVSWKREEYSHGPLIPLIALYLIMRRLSFGDIVAGPGRWLAIPVAAMAAIWGVLGTLSDIDDISQYGLIFAVAAIVIAAFGFRPALKLWAPVVYLFFMVPLPEVLYVNLFGWAQLVSSQFGTAIVRLAEIPVFLQGNIIDLGEYKLQVAEACSGLRYLFPLMSFGFLFAVVYRGAIWERTLLFLSTIPVAILMNSVRIGIISILVNKFGTKQAEGFIHFSEGWVVFIACIALLLLEAYILAALTNAEESPLERIELRFAELKQSRDPLKSVQNWRPMAVIVVLFAVGIASINVYFSQPVKVPDRLKFAAFPPIVGEWRGNVVPLGAGIEASLRADDYIVSNFVSNKTGEFVNLYVAYYEQQTNGAAPHSPQVCIPGNGWEISQFKTTQINFAGPWGETMPINRAVIQRGTEKQLVFFWYRERDRVVANEYFSKWYVLWDSLTRHRSDGALIRLVTPMAGENGEAAAQSRLLKFLKDVNPELEKFLPERRL